MDYKKKYLKYKNKYFNLSKRDFLDITFNSKEFGDHSEMTNIMRLHTEKINNLFYPVEDGINDDPKYYNLEFGMPGIFLVVSGMAPSPLTEAVTYFG